MQLVAGTSLLTVFALVSGAAGNMESRPVSAASKELRVTPAPLRMATRQTAVRPYNRGVQWLRQKRYTRAARDFRDAVRQSPKDPEAWCNLGVALYRLRQYHSAERALRQALVHRIDYDRAWNNLGAVYAKMGRNGYAAVAFQVALTYDASCAVARRNLRHITGGTLPAPVH